MNDEDFPGKFGDGDQLSWLARMAKKKIVGLGELLWDVFPEKACLGGAPANFAYITTILGDGGIVASRVGQDSQGDEALRRLQDLGLDVNHVQRDATHPTGTVLVEIDARGQPQYEICRPVAWDFIDWTDDWAGLAAQADAVCFGSLAQRSPESCTTIRKFLASASPAAVKVFDVNLRQSYYSRDVVADSMRLAEIVKLNDEELPIIMGLCHLPHEDETSSARQLLDHFDLKMVCITRGGRGSLLVKREQTNEHSGFKVKVADTVGSGDAFTAGMLHEYLRGSSLQQMNETANLVGAWVATEVGAMPVPKHGVLLDSLDEVRQTNSQNPQSLEV